MNYELKGIITIGEEIEITCCYRHQDILIDGKSLYKLLNEEIDYFDTMQVRYIILPKKPAIQKSFEELSGNVVTAMLYSYIKETCYSEWSCGNDGWDYLVNENGHSILAELAIYAGKYVHLVL